MIIYDCEIKKAILGKGETPLPGIEYCGGFRDFENMGCSVVGVYDYDEQRYRVFCDDNLAEFQELVNQTDLVIGFNNIAFDDPLIEASGVTIPPEKSWDILAEIWNAAGLGRAFTSDDHKGFGLDACCRANFDTGKSGNGSFAPVDWQNGNIGTVIDYCLMDVALTKQLVDRIAVEGNILDPRDSSNKLWIDDSPLSLVYSA